MIPTSIETTEGLLPNQIAKIANAPPSELDSLFVLWVRKGNDPRGQPIHFRFDGTLYQAIAKTKAYCETMGYRWIRVDPFIIDLDASMKRHLAGNI